MSSRYPTDCIGSEKKMGSGCKFCIGGMNVNCVGIDGSKGKSMIAVMQPLGEMVIPPFEVGHTDAELCELSRRLGDLDGEPRIVMEATGNYHLPVACFLYDSGFYVSVVNAMLLHGYGNNSLRRAKTDKKDEIKASTTGWRCPGTSRRMRTRRWTSAPPPAGILASCPRATPPNSWWSRRSPSSGPLPFP